MSRASSEGCTKPSDERVRSLSDLLFLQGPSSEMTAPLILRSSLEPPSSCSPKAHGGFRWENSSLSRRILFLDASLRVGDKDTFEMQFQMFPSIVGDGFNLKSLLQAEFCWQSRPILMIGIVRSFYSSFPSQLRIYRKIRSYSLLFPNEPRFLVESNSYFAITRRIPKNSTRTATCRVEWQPNAPPTSFLSLSRGGMQESSAITPRRHTTLTPQRSLSDSSDKESSRKTALKAHKASQQSKKRAVCIPSENCGFEAFWVF